MPEKSKFVSKTYYIGTENDDVLFLRKFIVKHTNAKSKHLSNIHELPRLEGILAKLKSSETTEADMNKQNQELRKIISEMDEKFLSINSKNKTPEHIEQYQPRKNQGAEGSIVAAQPPSSPNSGFSGFDSSSFYFPIEQSQFSPPVFGSGTPPLPEPGQGSHQLQPNDSLGPLVFIVSLPMLLVYAFEFSFWGSGVCLGFAWIIYLLFGLGSFSEL